MSTVKLATPETTPTCQPVKRGFGALPCPCCGEAEVTVSIDLNELDGDEACQCRECEAVFSVDAVRDFIAKWSRVLAWLETAPVVEE